MKTNRILYVATMFLLINDALSDDTFTVTDGNCVTNYYNWSSALAAYENCYTDETHTTRISGKTTYYDLYGPTYRFDTTTGEIYKVADPNIRYQLDSVGRRENITYQDGTYSSKNVLVSRDGEGNIIAQTEQVERYQNVRDSNGFWTSQYLDNYKIRTEYDAHGNTTHEVKYDQLSSNARCGTSDGVSSAYWYNSSRYFGAFYPSGTQGKTVSVQESYYTYDDEGRPLSREGTSCSVDSSGNFYDDDCQPISSCTPAFSELYTYGANGSCEMTNLLEGYSRACNEGSAQQPRRRIYTVKEATEAVQGNNNKNTFILRYR